MEHAENNKCTPTACNFTLVSIKFRFSELACLWPQSKEAGKKIEALGAYTTPDLGCGKPRTHISGLSTILSSILLLYYMTRLEDWAELAWTAKPDRTGLHFPTISKLPTSNLVLQINNEIHCLLQYSEFRLGLVRLLNVDRYRST